MKTRPRELGSGGAVRWTGTNENRCGCTSTVVNDKKLLPLLPMRQLESRKLMNPSNWTEEGESTMKTVCRIWWLAPKPITLLLWIAAMLTSTRATVAQEVGEVFRDCTVCPEMVVVPPGSFMMGSPDTEEGRWADEGPQYEVTIGLAFAVGVYEVTFEEWDACVNGGGCGSTLPALVAEQPVTGGKRIGNSADMPMGTMLRL